MTISGSAYNYCHTQKKNYREETAHTDKHTHRFGGKFLKVSK